MILDDWTPIEQGPPEEEDDYLVTVKVSSKESGEVSFERMIAKYMPMNPRVIGKAQGFIIEEINRYPDFCYKNKYEIVAWSYLPPVYVPRNKWSLKNLIG